MYSTDKRQNATLAYNNSSSTSSSSLYSQPRYEVQKTRIVDTVVDIFVDPTPGFATVALNTRRDYGSSSAFVPRLDDTRNDGVAGKDPIVKPVPLHTRVSSTQMGT